MSKVYDVIVIGASAAGMTAAVYAKRANMNVLLLEKLAPGGQMINSDRIENYVGGGIISGADLAYKMFEQTQELGIPMEYGTASKITTEGDAKVVHCEEGQVFSTRGVIIAAGCSPNKLGVEGEAELIGKGLSFCAICDGAQYKDKEVVVIGGGNAAVEEGFYLAGLCKKLTFVTMINLTADPEAVSELRAKDNVEVHEYCDIDKFTNADGKISIHYHPNQKADALHEVVQCDGVFEYIGQNPSSKPFRDLNITNERGYIKVDKNFETEVPMIYAAGDIIDKELRQIVTAAADGATAAHNLSGKLNKR